jgi:hypothetical protein
MAKVDKEKLKNKKKSSGMGSRFKERAKEQESRGGRGGAFRFPQDNILERYVPEKGIAKLDVLPYRVTRKNHPDDVAKGELWFRRPVKMHFNVGAQKKAVVCPTTFGKPCPICEYILAEYKNPNKDDKELSAIKLKEREGYVIRDADNPKKGLFLLEMSYHNFGKKLEEEIREAEDDAVAGFAELDGGYTLKIRWAIETMGERKFIVASRIDFVERDEIDEDILEQVPNMDDCVNLMEYEQLQKLFLEVGDEDEDEDEDDDPKSKSKSKSKSKKKDEDEEEEDDDDDDPSSKKKSKSKKKDEDEEEEDESSDDEDDEDSPSLEDLEEMSSKELKKIIKEKDLDVDPDDYKSTKKLAKAIFDELNPDEEEDDDNEDEEEEKPAKKADKKSKKKDEDEEEEESSDDDDDEEEKPKSKKKDNGKVPKCPVKGKTFGEDCDSIDDCDECDHWDKCRAATDEAEKSKKKKKK